jgi:type IV pilus assembly protein PilN
MAIRIPVNLASDPFRRDRPILVASAAVGVILLLTLIVQIGAIFSARAQAAETRAMLDKLDRQLTTLKADQAKLDGTLSKPENAEVLDRSQFLNSLIERKSISWTRIFADLEKVMPYQVRLVAVRLPQVDSQNQVLLDMVVGADSPGPVFELLKHLETSPQFGPTSVINSLPPSQTDKLWKYRVSVSYAQKL